MRLLVEDKDTYPPLAPVMNALAGAGEALGAEVVRWHDSKPWPGGHLDAALICNGWDRGREKKHNTVLDRMANRPTFWVENGWLTQATSFQLDPVGINGLASWAREPLGLNGRHLLTVRKEGDVLIALQSDGDSNLWHPDLAPIFQTNKQLLQHFASACPLPMRVRPHPRYPKCGAEALVDEHPLMTWDTSETFATALEGARAVAMINSTSGIEAIAAGLPLLTYGRNVYTHHPGVVFQMTGLEACTTEVLSALWDGQLWSGLYRDLQLAMVNRILNRQWYEGQLPWRLAMELEWAGVG